MAPKRGSAAAKAAGSKRLKKNAILEDEEEEVYVEREEVEVPSDGEEEKKEEDDGLADSENEDDETPTEEAKADETKANDVTQTPTDKTTASTISPFTKDGGPVAFTLDVSESEEEQEAEEKEGKYPIKIILVDSPKMKGFVFHLTGYGDKLFGDIAWSRSKDKVSKKFMTHIRVANRVCSVLDESTGTAIRYQGKFKVRACAVILEEEFQLEELRAEEWFDVLFEPAFKKMVDGKLFEDAFPFISKQGNTFEKRNTWSETVTSEDIPHIYLKHHEVNKTNLKFAKWINQSSENLYSIWPRGELPKKVWKNYGIKESIMDPLDKKALIGDTKKKPAPAAEE